MDDPNIFLLFGYSDNESGPFELNYVTFEDALSAAVSQFPMAEILYIARRCVNDTTIPCFGQIVTLVHINH